MTKAKQLNDKTGTHENCYLDQILAVDDVDERDKLVTLIDLVAGGIETVQYYCYYLELFLRNYSEFLNNCNNA